VDSNTWDERYAAHDHVWSVTPNQFVERELADLPPGRALDLACGEGRNAAWLASLGWHVTGVDFSRVAIDKARAAAPEVEWICADVTTWRPESSYDVTLLAYLHVTEEGRRAAVRMAFDALEPGGTFLLVGHDSTNLTEGTGGPQDGSVLMTADDILADLAARTFTVESAGRVARLVPDGGHGEQETLTAWDCLVRLTRRG
jgi:SAM-dependent methyltransferase